MSIGLPDTKLLWGRSGGLCSICQSKLSEDKKTSNGAFPFGEQAHIVAEEEDGPRGKSLLTLTERNCYHNLILLCPTCHTKIDKSPDDYPIELLHQLKSKHELWFEKSRVSVSDRVKQANDLIYAELVDACAKLCMFETWEIWTSWALSTTPQWQRQWTDDIEEFRRRIVRTVWPGTIPELENALKTLSVNLAMALKCFGKHCHLEKDNWLREIRFYQNADGTEEHYNKLLYEYNAWIDEQQEYLFDATRSANWVAEIVRRELNPLFFAIPGKFVVTVGPNMSASFVTRVLEYSDEEKKMEPATVMAKMKSSLDAERKRNRELWGE